VSLAVLQYGPVFSFTMVGKTFTYLLGSEAATLMFNSKNEDLNAEDVYSKLTTPVFGKGVAYDVPNPVSPCEPSGHNYEQSLSGALEGTFVPVSYNALSLICCRSFWNRRRC